MKLATILSTMPLSFVIDLIKRGLKTLHYKDLTLQQHFFLLSNKMVSLYRLYAC